MNNFRLLRFFLPLQNPIGFGLADFIAFGVAALLLLALLTRGKLESAVRAIGERPRWAMALLFTLPIGLRLLLLPHHPVPQPTVSDDFSYLLLGDTLAHFRLANPTHPMHRFFETVFVLQEPSYSSIYPLGQGILLALGEVIFHLPWAGVLISVGAMCAGCYWMLRAWVSPAWAFVGGLLAVMQFGPLNQWANNYWGGALSAIAGCLVFGALPRRNAILLGFGMGLQVLTRPFESIFLCICIVMWDRRFRLSNGTRGVPLFLLALLPALTLTLLQNKAVTGSFTTLPYAMSRYQYGIPTTLTFQKIPEPHRPLTQEQAVDYQAQSDVHDSAGPYLNRLFSRARFYHFFFLAPLYVALPFFLPALRRKPLPWVLACVLLFAAGANFYPYFYPHYVAAATCLFVLIAVVSLERLGRIAKDAMRLVVILCGAHFLFWYGIHLFGNDDLFIATGPYESWDYINFGDSEGRIAIGGQLAQSPGRQLVFVRYGPRHLLREWIRNAADIDRSKIVWALDLGPEENAKLIGYYPNRTVWTVEPDARPPLLTRVRSPAQ